jgi:hypothetical protein
MRTTGFRTAILSLLACASVGLASCSDDSENPGTSSPGGAGGTAAGASGSSGAAGRGGSPAGSGGGGSGGGGSGGLAGAPTMTCGTQTCTGLPGIPIVAPMGIPACCVGPAADKCGIDATLFSLGCVEKNQPGNPDDSCLGTDAGNAGGSGGGAGAGSDAASPDASGDASDASNGDASGGTSGASGAGGTGGGGREGGIGNMLIRGCCKPTGVCGVLINFTGLELGCVEIPQVDGGPAPQTCTPRGS